MQRLGTICVGGARFTVRVVEPGVVRDALVSAPQVLVRDRGNTSENLAAARRAAAVWLAARAT